LAAIWLTIALGVPCLVSSVTVGWGLPEVIATGLCPSAPPDIPAYPCSPVEYLLRMTVGPWALAGHMLIWCTWIGLAGAAGLFLILFLRPSRANGALPAAGDRMDNNTRRIE
jgi:hypothetical protein